MSNEIRQESRQIAFCEGEFLVKTLESEEELRQAYHLRHRVFAESLKWVPKVEDREEIDMYDLWGKTVGLIRDDGAVVGIARLLPSSGQFMLENEFGALLPDGYQIRKTSDTAEITRLAVDPEIQDKGLSSKMMQALLKGVYQWAVENDIRYYYLEVEHRFFRTLRALGFPCEMIGGPVVLPPATGYPESWPNSLPSLSASRSRPHPTFPMRSSPSRSVRSWSERYCRRR